MYKVFGISTCEGCSQLIAFLIAKGVKYEYHDIQTKEGLSLLASYGLAGEEAIPILVDKDGNLIDIDNEEVLENL